MRIMPTIMLTILRISMLIKHIDRYYSYYAYYAYYYADNNVHYKEY